MDEKTNRDVAAFPGKPIQLVSCLLEFISVAGVRTARAPCVIFVPKSVIGRLEASFVKVEVDLLEVRLVEQLVGWVKAPLVKM